MIGRVTHQGRYASIQRDLAGSEGAASRASAQITTGRRLLAWSDDAVAATRAAQIAAEIAELEAYGRAADDARARLDTQDAALQSASALLRRARELTISAVNSTLSPSAREGIADELDGIREQLVAIANTRHGDQAVFGGFAATAVSGDPATWTGDDGSVLRRLARDETVAVGSPGREVFGFAAGDDVFAVLDDIADHVRSGDVSALGGTDQQRLAARTAAVTDALGDIGVRATQAASAATRTTSRLDQISAMRSGLIDTDLAVAATELARAETARQAVLAAAARLQLPGLSDFL
jgi:flagellar hook-associated protein 3 FlgL